MGELWALPIMLRLGILQCLVLAAGRITGLKSKKNHSELPDIDLSDQLTDDEVVANCFISLRLLSITDWKEFFESLSLVETILREDPAGYYEGMDFETRDRYRKQLEELALQTGKGEQDIARQLIRLAQAELERIGAGIETGSEIGGGSNHNYKNAAASTAVAGSIASEIEFKEWAGFLMPREAHVGYFLLDKGRQTLEASLDYRRVWHRSVRRWIFAHPTLVYLGSISGLTALFIFLLVGYALNSNGAGWQAILTGLLGLIPSLTVAINLVNWMITNTVKPRVLPKMDFKDGLPADCSSIVVVPTLLTSTDEVRSLLDQLELHYLRNPDPFLFFALLTDFADALQQRLPGDEELLKRAKEGVCSLNEKYRRGTGSPFYLFHRERRWNPAEGLWIGWERKRGKLHELNQLILGNTETSYTTKLGDLSILPTINTLSR
jgi:cyclic beta-1,2-glucan synthetase